MQRVPEPELMDDEQQARAYAQADFTEPHNHFVELFRQSANEELTGHILDLGCGPADICIRMARAFPKVNIVGIDAADAMLSLGRQAVVQQELEKRISLIRAHLPLVDLPRRTYSAITSNSLLHHLPDPMILWQTIQNVASKGVRIFVMDLMRPGSEAEAQLLVDTYSPDEPDILRRDFYHSLLAAYTVEEVKEQLAENNMSFLQATVVSDRHFVVFGQWA